MFVFVAIFWANLTLGSPETLEDSFAAEGIAPETATIVVENISTGEKWVVNQERAQTRFSPASTSKILHTLIGFEEGTVTTDRVFEWDGQKRWAKSWNQDQTIDTAYKRSALWVYQRITSELGHEKMALWLANLDYGNAETGTEETVTTYWVDNSLQISAEEQVEFLDLLSAKALPLSPSTYETAFPIMLADKGEGWALYAKTGWFVMDGEESVGWYVGWVEREDGNRYVFALNMPMDSIEDAPKRISIARSVLTHIGATD